MILDNPDRSRFLSIFIGFIPIYFNSLISRISFLIKIALRICDIVTENKIIINPKIIILYEGCLFTKYNEYIKTVLYFNWIQTKPGRQWSSSINPIIENTGEWYGLFYNKKENLNN